MIVLGNIKKLCQLPSQQETIIEGREGEHGGPGPGGGFGVKRFKKIYD